MNRSAGDNAAAEAELVRSAQAGDHDAFAALVARYQDRIFNTCFRMCHNHADALDLTQTAFLKALEALPRFDARARFYTWLFRIAVNLTLSHRRQQKRRHTASLDAVHGDGRMPEPAARPDAAAQRRGPEQEELRGRVEHALAQLDDEFRIAVVLKDVEDMDYATIGEILEVPLGTVKSRIYRGRMLLRQLLSAEKVHLETA
ncbi:MAG: sigma-70 family RNA polymerase sigma factor [Phycisphaerae bacterium]|nr:sigma-70 family RNA polymerase sigma factor [Phycisphaerae bacterium]